MAPTSLKNRKPDKVASNDGTPLGALPTREDSLSPSDLVGSFSQDDQVLIVNLARSLFVENFILKGQLESTHIANLCLDAAEKFVSASKSRYPDLS